MSLLIGFVIALLGSAITTITYVVIVWRVDRYEKEPFAMLVTAFAWGMIPAIVLSIILEAGFEPDLGDELASLVAANVGIAPVVEESAKGLALLAFLVFSYRELDNILDGIVYGALIGLGFAFTENILYVLSAVMERGLAGGVAVLFLRTVIFGVNHAFFTGLMGVGVGAARLKRSSVQRIALIATGWLAAVLFHALHNLGTSLAETTRLASLGISLLSDWGGIAMLLVIVFLAWQKERQWMKEELAAEVAVGVLTEQEYHALATPGGWQRLLTRALRHEGWPAYKRLLQRHTLFAELAFKKRQMRLMGGEPGVEDDVARLRAALAAAKGEDSTHMA